MQPTRDQYGFNTETVAPHTPNHAAAYTVQWSSSADFSDLSTSPTSGQYNIPAITGDGVELTCHGGCGHTIGQEIQNVTVASSNGYPLTSGTFSLLYVGPQNLRVYLLVAQGSPRVRVLMRSLTVNNNDFFRVGRTLYQVQSVSSADPTQLVFTQPFTGGFSDITQAYYVPFPSLGLLSYAATSAQVDAYLEAQLASLYPLYMDNFDVARQTLTVGSTVGYSWLVTFTGEMFSGEVGRRDTTPFRTFLFLAKLSCLCISVYMHTYCMYLCDSVVTLCSPPSPPLPPFLLFCVYHNRWTHWYCFPRTASLLREMVSKSSPSSPLHSPTSPPRKGLPTRPSPPLRPSLTAVPWLRVCLTMSASRR